MQIDTKQHFLQLKALGYVDGDTIYYREFPPRGGKGSAVKKQRNLPTIIQEQNNNKGLYFVVNGGGQSDSQITGGRALFAEWDDRPLDEQETIWQKKGFLEPSFQVKTRKSCHSYWVFTQPIPIEDWKILQANLLNFLDADRTLKNPSRVLRVAGGWHIKPGEDPIQCQLINLTDRRYTQTEIEAALATMPVEEKPKPKPRLTPSIAPNIPLINCLPLRDRQLISDGAGEGSRNQTGYGLAKDLIATERYLQGENIAYSDSAYNLFLDYCRRCDQSDWGEREWEQVWRSGEKDAPSSPPLDPDKIDNCLRKWAKENGEKLPPKPVLTSQPLAIPQPETARVYGGTKTLNSGELARFVEENLAARLSFDELRTEILLDGQKIILGNDLKFWFLKQFGELATKDDIYDCLTYYARQNAFNPLQKYLESLDCAPIPINNLAARYFGRPEPIYNRMVEMWLISCVARGLTPLDDPHQQGSQVDHTLILQSGQGKYKSTWFKTLGGKWFSDSVKDIESKDSLMIVHSNWIIELSELDRITGRKQAGAIKHWLTQRTDSFRKPYAREIEPNLPRRCVFCGTVNPKTFLVDDENRRFWIVPIDDGIEAIDIPLMERERDGIWRAAYQAYKAGMAWWPTEEEKAAIAGLSQDFKEVDAWAGEIEAWLLNKTMVSSFEVLTDCLGFQPSQIKRADDMRVGKVLDSLGWDKTQRKEQTDPLTGKKVYRRVRIAPVNFQNNYKGWLVGQKHIQSGFQSDQPKIEVGQVGHNSENMTNLPTYRPTLEYPKSLDMTGIDRPTDLNHQLSNRGNGKKIEMTKDQQLVADTIMAEMKRLSWNRDEMRRICLDRYGKSNFLDLNEAQLVDLVAYMGSWS
jgi:predicted P-loop ATPase